jgi:voltage-gated potassium channel
VELKNVGKTAFLFRRFPTFYHRHLHLAKPLLHVIRETTLERLIVANLTVILIVTMLLAKLESLPVFDSFWLTMTTITTVGYGDITPHTSYGKFVCCFLMLFGITMFGMLSAKIIETYQRGDEE